LLAYNNTTLLVCEHETKVTKAMTERISHKDEWRFSQAALTENFITTNTTYLTLRERICNQDLSAVDCAKLYGDETIALAASPDTEKEL
jgi:hypothetical protein